MRAIRLTPHAITRFTCHNRLFSMIALLTCALFLALGAEQAKAEYFGAPTYVAFQANTGEMITYETPAYTGVSGQLYHSFDGVAAGTSPSIDKGGVTAFHASGTAGHLWIFEWNSSTGGHETPLGMSPGSSPSITAGREGHGYRGYTVAFRAAVSNRLWTYEGCEIECTPVGHETPLGIAVGSNPSITSDTYRAGAEVAFEAAVSHRLWLFNTNTGVGTETAWQIEENTSPSIIAIEGAYAIAFQGAGSHLLWHCWTPNLSSPPECTGTSYQVETGTSPSIARTPGNGWEVAFHGKGSGVWTYSSSGVATNHLNGMSPDTSPSITSRENNSKDEVAFQADTHYLWTALYPNGGSTGLGMAGNTSPSIAES
jgi:hypothetical protein